MGLDAEEGLAHDDKRRDVEDEVRRQIVEAQAVVVHEPPDEGVKWEAQSAEEVGKKYVGMRCPSSGSRCVMSLDRYPAPRSFSMSFSLTEETIHLPWPPDPDMIECFLEEEKMGTWALELDNGRTERKRRHG